VFQEAAPDGDINRKVIEIGVFQVTRVSNLKGLEAIFAGSIQAVYINNQKLVPPLNRWIFDRFILLLFEVASYHDCVGLRCFDQANKRR
jgi:hypothetical protein